jgi:hypothetical protein
MTPTNEPSVYAATVPEAFVVPQWDLMYFIEVTDARGNGANWPDLARETPYVIVKVARPGLSSIK